jgi:hypothetical protein
MRIPTAVTVAPEVAGELDRIVAPARSGRSSSP